MFFFLLSHCIGAVRILLIIEVLLFCFGVFFCYYCFIIFPTFVSLQQQDEEIIQEIQREGEAELTKKSAGEFRYTSICSVVISVHHDMHRISIVRISKSFNA